MTCELCDGSGWTASEHEEEVGFVDTPCPKCNWSLRALAPIPVVVEELDFAMPDSQRIELGIELAWAEHGPGW